MRQGSFDIVLLPDNQEATPATPICCGTRRAWAIGRSRAKPFSAKVRNMVVLRGGIRLVTSRITSTSLKRCGIGPWGECRSGSLRHHKRTSHHRLVKRFGELDSHYRTVK